MNRGYLTSRRDRRMSTPSHPLPKPEFRREHRLGLVVYGGVSLAIYMNGICREFYNAVRGRGIYKLIKALTDADIVVDILSGTSAGGINGVLLSYALANSTKDAVVDFQEFGQIWRESGNIRELMHHPSTQETQRESVLDGAGYYQTALAEAFEKGIYNRTDAPEGEWVSEFNELDLFVTGTDMLGRISQVFDDTGQVIEVKNHRQIFRLKHRQGRYEPFNPNSDPADLSRTPEQTYQSLAKLCRITSCFPVAFPSVNVGLKEDTNDVDQRLIQWGQLENRDLPEQRPKEGYQLHFIDGGVLDNRPFSYTIKDIYFRTANRPVDRKLIYIDPNPDRFLGNPKFNAMEKPTTWEVLQDALVGLPTYESISNDLELIQAQNDKIYRYNSLLASVETKDPAQPGTANEITVNEEIYLRSRLIGLRDRILPLILRMDREQTTASGEDKKVILDKTGQQLIAGITSQTDRQDKDIILQQASQQIRNLDIDYALRKHFYIIDKLFKHLDETSDIVEYNKQRLLVSRLNRQLKLLEVIRFSLDTLLSHPQVSESFYSLLEESLENSDSEFQQQWRKQVYDRLLRLHRFFLDADGLDDLSPSGLDQNRLEFVPANFFKTLPTAAEQLELELDQLQEKPRDWLPQKQISSIIEQFQQKISQLDNDPSLLNRIWLAQKYQDSESDNCSELFCSILYQIDQASETLIKNSNLIHCDDIINRYQNFCHLDRVLYPFEYLTNLSEKDIIETIRFSPDDAQLGLGKGKTLDDKLAGDTFRAFGGFFKKSWRSNDMLWGRLDGLNRIVEALVTRESVQNFSRFLARQTYKEGCTEDEYIEQLIQDCFPDCTVNTRQKLKSHLRLLAEPNLSDAAMHIILDDLVLEGHRSILMTDLETVIEDEISEQLTWNRQRVKPTDPDDVERLLTQLGDEPPSYQPVPGYFEKTVNTLAAGKLAKDAIGRFSPQAKEDFFRNQYRIGKETILKDIPGIVLANLATRAALILRDIMITTLGKRRANKLQGLLSYQFVNKSLQLVYWWLQLRSPAAFQSRNFIGKRPLILILQVIFLLVAVISVVITVSKSPIPTAIALIAILLFWLLGYALKKS
ncbi:MAG: patatin-like protein [Coleofasciculus sp. G1-WW12-02]|uniref:patatin-like protein n=1 Tax=Coleofasciculus sp. G1-WW12-02 TaxID=3068483 RepID=UPI0032FF6484